MHERLASPRLKFKIPDGSLSKGAEKNSSIRPFGFHVYSRSHNETRHSKLSDHACLGIYTETGDRLFWNHLWKVNKVTEPPNVSFDERVIPWRRHEEDYTHISEVNALRLNENEQPLSWIDTPNLLLWPNILPRFYQIEMVDDTVTNTEEHTGRFRRSNEEYIMLAHSS